MEREKNILFCLVVDKSHQKPDSMLPNFVCFLMVRSFSVLLSTTRQT